MNNYQTNREYGTNISNSRDNYEAIYQLPNLINGSYQKDTEPTKSLTEGLPILRILP